MVSCPVSEIILQTGHVSRESGSTNMKFENFRYHYPCAIHQDLYPANIHDGEEE